MASGAERWARSVYKYGEHSEQFIRVWAPVPTDPADRGASAPIAVVVIIHGGEL